MNARIGNSRKSKKSAIVRMKVIFFIDNQFSVFGCPVNHMKRAKDHHEENFTVYALSFGDFFFDIETI